MTDVRPDMVVFLKNLETVNPNELRNVPVHWFLEPLLQEINR